MFQVVKVEAGREPVPHVDDEGFPYVLPDGPSAAKLAKDLSYFLGGKWQPRPLPPTDDSWKDRERSRLRDGTYLPPVWHEEPWFRDHPLYAEHFCHVSVKDSSKVSYTENALKGAADKQAPAMRPGVYLQRFFSDVLDGYGIKAWALKHAQQHENLELKLAWSPEDITRVYEDGPSSCMGKSLSCFSSSVHPCSVYGAGDLAIAYLEDDDGHITARVLCRPSKHAYGRIYGDEERITTALEAQGYDYNPDAFEGAKMLRIVEDGCFVVPYLDYICTATDCGDFLRIDSSGEIGCETTCGLSENDRAECECCGDRVHEEDLSTVMTGTSYYHEQMWCRGCCDSHAFMCDHSHELWSDSYAVGMADGSTWSQSAFDENGATCDATDENYPQDEVVVLECGTVWSLDYFEEHGFQDAETGECFKSEDEAERVAAENKGQQSLPLSIYSEARLCA